MEFFVILFCTLLIIYFLSLYSCNWKINKKIIKYMMMEKINSESKTIINKYNNVKKKNVIIIEFMVTLPN